MSGAGVVEDGYRGHNPRSQRLIAVEARVFVGACAHPAPYSVIAVDRENVDGGRS